MSANDVRRNPDQKQPPRRTIRDVPGCIKYIILLFLLLLLFVEYYAGEFRGFPKVSQLVWLIFFFKILLIILLLILIWVQRQLFCEITSPIGCAIKEYDPSLHMWIIRVRGTASGTAFGGYTLSVTRGGMPFPMPVIYPSGGSSGTSPVTNGELGILDVTGIEPNAFRVTLTVTPSGFGSSSSCSQDFEILLKTVSITAIGNVTAQIIGAHPDPGPLEVLKEVELAPPPGPEASVGSSISVWGTADYDGCGRQMSEYVLQYKEIPVAHAHTWRYDAPDPWTDINFPLPFGDATHPRVYDSFFGTIDNTIKTPNFLTRQWDHVPILQGFDAFLNPINDLKWITDALAWATGSEGSPSALNGRYTVRLRVRHQVIIGPPDPTPPELLDAATVWIDNRAIEGRITGMAVAGGPGFGNCDELSLSQFVTPGSPATRSDADIRGRAWDPVILDSYLTPPIGVPLIPHPNDNFGNYTLVFKKDGSTDFRDITPAGGATTRVPNVLQEAPLTPLVEPIPPSPPDTGSLSHWDIVKALDAGPRLPASPAEAPYPKIYRNERCAYLIVLEVRDTTRLGDSGTTHYIRHDWPFCIMNDIPNGTTFPWP